jgi:flagellar hook assembly protein FlgD
MGNGVYRSSSVSVLPSPQLTIITPGTNKGLLSFPNPVSGATQIQWRPLADPRNSTLNIYDINGKTVRSISVSLNEGSALWDGTSAAGASVVSGLYIFKLKAQDRMLQGQCIINR